MPPPFENFLLDTLNSEQKPSAKKTVDREGQKPVGHPAMILKFTGRVEKILTGSISGALSEIANTYRHLLYYEVIVYCTGRLSQTATVLAYT